jgi:hypothetical protein
VPMYTRRSTGKPSVTRAFSVLPDFARPVIRTPRSLAKSSAAQPQALSRSRVRFALASRRRIMVRFNGDR